MNTNDKVSFSNQARTITLEWKIYIVNIDTHPILWFMFNPKAISSISTFTPILWSMFNLKSVTKFMSGECVNASFPKNLLIKRAVDYTYLAKIMFSINSCQCSHQFLKCWYWLVNFCLIPPFKQPHQHKIHWIWEITMIQFFVISCADT